MEKSGLIKARFAELGLTQAKAAEKLGTTQQLVNAYINGVRKFGTQVAQKWSDAFGFSAAWLLTGEGSMLKENMPHVTGDFNTIGGNAINIGNISNSVGASSKQVDALKIENARLQAENKHLQEMVAEKDARLAEKERTIDILLRSNN